MKKWAESKTRYIKLNDLSKFYRGNIPWTSQIKNSECNGSVSHTVIHDGTLLFTVDAFRVAINELVATNTKQIGKITHRSDFVICDMRYGKAARVMRDTVTIRFKYEE